VYFRWLLQISITAATSKGDTITRAKRPGQSFARAYRLYRGHSGPEVGLGMCGSVEMRTCLDFLQRRFWTVRNRNDFNRYNWEVRLCERLGAAPDPSATLDLSEYHSVNCETLAPESLLARRCEVPSLAFMDDLERIPVWIKYISGVVFRIVFHSCPR
jgi:hypothetical protein